MKTTMNLFSQFTDRTAKTRFKERLKECEWLKACTAYWTIKPSYFGGDLLLEVLKREASFFCVHCEHPTNWIHLKELSDKEAHIFLHYFKWKTKNSINKRSPLLHAKVNLFGLPNNQAEIWIGSYNMTNKALTDKNIETVTIIQTSQDSEIYVEVLGFLNKVREKCEVLDLQKMLAYEMSRLNNLKKWKEQFAQLFNIKERVAHIEKEYVIWLAGFGVSELHKYATALQIICMDDFLLRALNRLQKTVLIEAWDAATGKSYYYRAAVRLAARVDKSKESYDIKLPPTRYAIIKKGMVGGILEKREVVGEVHLKKAKLFATVVIEEELERIHVYKEPEFWQEVKNNKQIVKLALDKKALEHPEKIKAFSLEETKDLLNYYRSLIGLGNQKKKLEMTFLPATIDFSYFSDKRVDINKRRLIVGLEEQGTS